MLMAEAGRANGFGEERPPIPPAPTAAGLGERVSEDGCWRMEKTKVLLATRRAHCGWVM
jgi:hypothetical protein